MSTLRTQNVMLSQKLGRSQNLERQTAADLEDKLREEQVRWRMVVVVVVVVVDSGIHKS